MGFGKMLERKMNAKGLRQADLVRLTGIPKTTLSSMINRDNTKIDVQFFIKICKVLGCNPMDFSDEVQQIENSTSLAPSEMQLLSYFRGFNEEGQEKLLDTASDMAQLDRYKKDSQPDLVEKEA